MGVLARLREKCGIYRADIDLPHEEVAAIMRGSKAPAWFWYAFERRAQRWHVCDPSFWIARNLPRASVVLETGCGCALNLIWLGQRGFRRLHGVDIDPQALAAGRELARLASLDIGLVEADCTGAACGPESIDLLIALNWTYHVESFDLGTFLLSYRERMPAGGHVVFDVVDTSYNEFPGNAYLTSDRHLPEGERRPSEYRLRYGAQAVALALEKAGFESVVSFSRDQAVPVIVHVARRLA